MSDEQTTDHPAEAAEEDVLPDDLVEQVAAHDESLASVVARLTERVDALEAEREDLAAELDELTGRLKRAHADFDNYKKRVERQQEALRERATDRLIEPLVAIRTDLKRAIEADDQSLEDLREGVKMTLRDVDHLLDAENVEEIRPDPGEPVDPTRHEVMVRVDSDQPAEAIAEVFEPGYVQGERVISEAKVAVSDGEAADETDEE